MSCLHAVFSNLERLGFKPVTQVFAAQASPGIQRMAEDLRTRRYEPLLAAFERITPDRYDEALRALLEALTGGNESRLPNAMDAIRVWHDDPAKGAFHASMLLGWGSIREAWRARGGQWASKVSEEAWPVFFSHLENADELLAKAASLRPGHPEPLSNLLITARGLQMGGEEERVRFQALLDVAPLHVRGHVLMLENLKAKWGGSHEAMFAFARQHAERAPDGHALGCLPVHAHWEIRNLLDSADDERADAYFKRPEVAREIIMAWRRTGGSPRHVVDGYGRVLYNLMAATLFLCGQRELARQALMKMKGQCLHWPWCALSDSLAESVNVGWVVDRVARSVGARR